MAIRPTRFIELHSGPGAGKSTLAAGVSHILRAQHKLSCEYVSEIAKTYVWNDDRGRLHDQNLVWAEQRHSLLAPDGKVDVIVSDSPTLLSLIYDRQPQSHAKDCFRNLVLADINTRTERTYHWFVRRITSYDEAGRVHGPAEVAALDEQVRNMLNRYNMDFKICTADDAMLIANTIMKDIQREQQQAARRSRRSMTVPPAQP